MRIKPCKYELKYSYPCSGYITFDGEDTGTFLQGEDYENLESEIEQIEKMAKHKKIGWNNANRMIDDLLSNYMED